MSGFGVEFKTNIQGAPGSLGRVTESADIKSSEESGDKTSSFGDTLKSMMQEANASQLNADHKMEELVAGRNKDIHGTVLAMEKADINFRLLTQVRNKVIEAYREIMRMQV